MTKPLPSRMAACLAATLLCLSLPAQAQVSDAKPGLWEFKHQIQSAGRPNLPAEIAALAAQIDRLPPQLRAVVEQQLATVGLGVGDGGALRICVTPEQAKRGLIREGQTEGSCTFTQVRQSGNVLSGQVSCQQPPGKGTFQGILHTPEHFSATADLDGAQGRVQLTAEGRHVSSDCGALARKR